METIHAIILKKYLSYFAKKLCNRERLTSLLNQNYVLDNVEMDTIMHQLTEYESAVKLAIIMTKKNENEFLIFIKSLKQSGNAHIAQTFLKTEECGFDNFEITRILGDDVFFVEKWKFFCLSLDFDNCIILDLESMENRGSPLAEIIFSILQHWKSRNSNSDATIIHLLENLRRLGCMRAADEIEKHVRHKIERSGESAVDKYGHTVTASIPFTENAMWFNIRMPTIFYMGREQELIVIEDQWKRCAEMKRMLIVAVTGLGGIGKTELARNYAKRFYENVKGHCIWIDAETQQAMTQSFQDLANTGLNLPLQDDSGKEISFQVLLQEVYSKLSHQNCLIILDNIQRFDDSCLISLMELASKQPPASLKPLIITTSRFRPAKRYFGSNCVHIELDVLTKEESIEFIAKSLQIHDFENEKCKQAIDHLCARLQCFPLAIRQAVSFISSNLDVKPSEKDTTREIIQYLSKLENEAKVLLNHKLPTFEALESHSRTTLFTWRITIEKIRGTNGIGDMAINVLNIISFLSPENISIEFLAELSKAIKNHKFSLNEPCLQLLADYSMISMTKDDISIHRLVQEVTRIDLDERGVFSDVLSSILKCFLELLKNETVPESQLTHFATVWQYASRHTDLIKMYAELPVVICQKLHRAGKYWQVLDFNLYTLQIMQEVLGNENRGTLQVKLWKAVTLKSLGEYDESITLLKELYETLYRLFGEEDSDSMLAVSELGDVYCCLGNYEKALYCYQNVVTIQERVLGVEHPETINIKSNIAIVLQKQGKFEEANKLICEIMETNEWLLGSMHPSSLATKCNLATLKFEQKEYGQALVIFKDVLEYQRKVFGRNHPHTLDTMYSIALALKYLGRIEEALNLARKVCGKRIEILGPNHPNTILSKELVEVLANAPQKLVKLSHTVTPSYSHMFASRTQSQQERKQCILC